MHMFYRVMKGIYQFDANLLSYIPTKYYWNRSTSDLAIAKSKIVNFFLKHSVVTGAYVTMAGNMHGSKNHRYVQKMCRVHKFIPVWYNLSSCSKQAVYQTSKNELTQLHITLMLAVYANSARVITNVWNYFSVTESMIVSPAFYLKLVYLVLIQYAIMPSVLFKKGGCSATIPWLQCCSHVSCLEFNWYNCDGHHSVHVSHC